MTSRERVLAAINHIKPDRVPVDMGATVVSGICAVALTKLKSALGINGPAKVMNPYCMLAEVEEGERQMLGLDLVRIGATRNNMGFYNANHKVWTQFDGTDVLIGEGFKYSTDSAGNVYYHPGCDLSLAPSAKMPHGGYYFDAIIRQDYCEDALNAREDYKEDFVLYTDEALRDIEKRADDYYRNTEYALVGDFFQGGLADFGKLPGFCQKKLGGIRGYEDWMMAYHLYPDYVKDVFAFQTEITLKNLELYKQALGDKILVVGISGADFGTQQGELISPDMFREFFAPFYSRMNEWVHKNTAWKTLFHTCGSVVNLLDEFVACGVDILNPVQCSAKGMRPEFLKSKYGGKLVFWGGGIDTQRTLPFGTQAEVRAEVFERLEIFSQNGGYVFNAIHNIQPDTPSANIIAMFDAVREFNAR